MGNASTTDDAYINEDTKITTESVNNKNSNKVVIPDAPPLIENTIRDEDIPPPPPLERQTGYYKEGKITDCIKWRDYDAELEDIRRELKQLHKLHKVSTSTITLPGTCEKETPSDLWKKRNLSTPKKRRKKNKK